MNKLDNLPLLALPWVNVSCIEIANHIAKNFNQKIGV